MAACFLIFAAVGCTSPSEPEPEEPAGVTPQNPHPARAETDVGDWTLSITNFRPNVTEELLASDPYALLPEPGFQIATYTVEATYNGPGSAGIWEDYLFGLWVDGSFYMQCTATAPNSLYLAPEVSTGTTVSGENCVDLPVEATEPVAYVEHWTSKDRTYFAIDPAAPEEIPTDGTSSAAPLPAGTAVEIGDWTIAASNLRLDALDDLPDEALWGELPAGRQLVLYDVSGTYAGPGIVSMVFEVNIGIWVEGALYAEGCEVIVPDYFADAPDVEAGGTASGTACAELPDDITDTADLLFCISYPESAGQPVYFVEVK